MVNVPIFFYRLRQRALFGSITLVLSAFALTGCGYKGPLYLPPPPDTLGEQGAQSNPGASLGEFSSGDSLTPANPSLEPTPVVIE